MIKKTKQCFLRLSLIFSIMRLASEKLNQALILILLFNKWIKYSSSEVLV